MKMKLLSGIIGWSLFSLVAIIEFIEMYNYRRINTQILGLALIGFGFIAYSILKRPDN